MNAKKRLGIVVSTSAMIFSLAGCNNDSIPEAWKFSKDDITSFSTVNSVAADENGSLRYVVNMRTPIFSKTIDKDGLILYNFDKAKEEGSSSGKDYIDYALMKKYEIKYNNLENSDDLAGFSVSIDPNIDASSVYGLIRKDYNKITNSFIQIEPYQEDILTPEEQEAQKAKEEQEKFEEKYASSEFSWEKGGKLISEIVTNVGVIITGLMLDSPISAISSYFNILMSFGNYFGASGPTIQDVLNKLKQMDAKLNQIIQYIQDNHRQLLTETARTQAAVDKVLLEQYNSAMTAFTTDYQNKIDDFNRSYGAVVQDKFKETVAKDNLDVKVCVYKNDKGEWCSRQYCDLGLHAEDIELTYTIPNFNNAFSKLESDNNVIKLGFIDEMYKDIDNALKTATVPEGMDKTNLRYFLFTNIVESFNKEYFSNHKSEAQEFASLMINASKRYAGIGSDSIVATYYSRLKYMYNFGSEIKAPMTTYLGRSLYNLDINVAKAASYLVYAGYNDDELATTYKAARSYMVNFKKVTLKELPDNYSFITGNKITGELFGARFEHKFPKKGNHPTYESKTHFVKFYNPDGPIGYLKKDVNIGEYAFTDNVSVLRINFRLNLLKELGLILGESTLINYLDYVDVMEDNVIHVRDNMLDVHTADESINRFATNITYRNMDASRDGNISLYCQDVANGKSTYFNTGKWFNYSGSHGGEYWSGRIMESDFVDVNSGELLANKMITAKATYRESHGIWINDEDWLFSTHDDSLGGAKEYACFFALTIQE